MQPSQENNKEGKVNDNIQFKREQKMNELDSPHNKNPYENHLKCSQSHLELAPFLSKTLSFTEKSEFAFGFSYYYEKQNLILVFPGWKDKHPIQFYDATTLLPFKGRKTLHLDGEVYQVSACPETDTLLFACNYGNIYKYDFWNHSCIRLKKYKQELISKITFLDSAFYAFAIKYYPGLYIGNLEDSETFCFQHRNYDTSFLLKIEKKNLLVAGFENGLMRIYRTDFLPNRIPVIFSKRIYPPTAYLVEQFTIKGRDFLITGSEKDGMIRIWHFVKGKMRLLRVVKAGKSMFSCLYLEKYKMIVTGHETRMLKFWGLLSGELKHIFYLEKQAVFANAFLMKDKDAIGIVDWNEDCIKILQLSLEGS